MPTPGQGLQRNRTCTPVVGISAPEAVASTLLRLKNVVCEGPSRRYRYWVGGCFESVGGAVEVGWRLNVSASEKTQKRLWINRVLATSRSRPSSASSIRPIARLREFTRFGTDLTTKL